MDQWVLDIEIVLVVKDGDLLILICIHSPTAAPIWILVFLRVRIGTAFGSCSIRSSWRDGNSVKRNLLGAGVVCRTRRGIQSGRHSESKDCGKEPVTVLRNKSLVAQQEASDRWRRILLLLGGLCSVLWTQQV